MGEPVRVESAVKAGEGASREAWSIVVRAHGGDPSRRRLRVVRVAAPPGRDSTRTGPEEFALLDAAHAMDVRVPRPLFLCEDPRVLGDPFFVSACPHETEDGGRTAGSGGDGVESSGPSPAMEGEPGQPTSGIRLLRPELAAQLGRELAKLHRMTPPGADLEFLHPVPADLPAARIEGFRRRLDAIGDPHPVLEWTMRRLERSAPERTAIVLCHGDPGPGSYVVDGANLVTILDWTRSRWGDPCEDIGAFGAACRRLLSGHPGSGDAAARAGFLEGYRDISGLDIDEDRLRYWEIMAILDCAVSALEQGHRFVAGGERSIEVALAGRRVAELEIDLLAETDRLAMERVHA